jgi:hypothetical protein
MLLGEPSPKHAIAQIIAHKSAADLLAGALSLSLSLSLSLRSLEGVCGFFTHESTTKETEKHGGRQ